MKQKLFLLLMLVVALAACTKDDEHDDYMSEASSTDSMKPKVTNSDNPVKPNYELGTFEGEWILDQQVISQPDTIFVKEDNKRRYLVDFVIPGDIPILKALEALGMENAEYTPSNYLRHLYLNPQGISENKTYYDLFFIDYNTITGDGPIPAIYGELYNDVDHSKKVGYIMLMSDNHNKAIYDSETGLWTLKITISQILSFDNYCDLPSPLVLLFVAKKRL